MYPFDFTQHLQAAAARHGNVQHHHIPFPLPHEIQGFLRVTRLAESGALEVVSKDLLQPLPHYRVIVCDEDSHGSTAFQKWHADGGSARSRWFPSLASL